MTNKAYPLLYLDDQGKKIRLKRDKFRNYHSEDGRFFNKSTVWSKFKFLKHEKHQVKYVTNLNGFKVRAPL